MSLVWAMLSFHALGTPKRSRAMCPNMQLSREGGLRTQNHTRTRILPFPGAPKTSVLSVVALWSES